MSIDESSVAKFVRRGSAFAFAIVGLSSFFSGCTYVAKKIVEPPTVALDRVTVKDVGASGATVVFGVAVDNPNPFMIRVDQLKYDVDIGGKPISTGKLEHAAEVGGRSKAIVDIPVPVKYSEVFSSLFDFVSKGTSTYRVRGEASFGVLSVPFDKSGDLKLKP